MPLVDVIEALRNKKTLPERTVTITFDDAYLSIYTNAFPILREHGFPFTIFVTPTPVDKNYQKFLSWEQLREMTEAGATLANHTMNHAHSVERLSGETEAQWLSRFRLDLESTETRIQEKNRSQC